MPRSMVGLLAAVGAAMSILAGLTKGCLVWPVGAFAAVSTGFAAYMALQDPDKKKLVDNYGKYAAWPYIASA